MSAKVKKFSLEIQMHQKCALIKHKSVYLKTPTTSAYLLGRLRPYSVSLNDCIYIQSLVSLIQYDDFDNMIITLSFGKQQMNIDCLNWLNQLCVGHSFFFKKNKKLLCLQRIEDIQYFLVCLFVALGLVSR